MSKRIPTGSANYNNRMYPTLNSIETGDLLSSNHVNTTWTVVGVNESIGWIRIKDNQTGEQNRVRPSFLKTVKQK